MDKRKKGHNKGGRKKLDDKAIPVSTYIKESIVNMVGGMDSARTIAKEAIEKKAKYAK